MVRKTQKKTGVCDENHDNSTLLRILANQWQLHSVNMPLIFSRFFRSDLWSLFEPSWFFVDSIIVSCTNVDFALYRYQVIISNVSHSVRGHQKNQAHTRTHLFQSKIILILLKRNKCNQWCVFYIVCYGSTYFIF